MRSAHLFGIKHCDQRTRGDREPLHSGAVEHDRHDAMTHTIHQTTRFHRCLPSREVAQRCLDWTPVGLLRRCEFEHALDASNVNGGRGLHLLAVARVLRRTHQSSVRQQTYRREREHARAYTHFHSEIPIPEWVMGGPIPADFAPKANEMRTKCDL